MLVVPPVDPFVKGILANPTPTDVSQSPDPPLPLPPPDNGDDGHGSGDEGDGDDGDLGSTLSQITQPRTTRTLDVTFTSTPTSTSIAVGSSSSTARATSITNDSSSTSTFSDSAQTTLYSSVASSEFQPPKSSESASITLTSTSTAMSLSSTSSDLSTATVLPEGQTNHGLEVKAEESPLTTAGIVLASIFGAVALVTIMYLLYQLRRRRKSGDSQLADSEKQLMNNSSSQETGVIFGRRRASTSPRAILNSYAQHDEQVPTQGHGRPRFSFLNRRWFSTGTQISNSQEQMHEQSHQQHDEQHISNTTSTMPASPQRWPSPFFFTRSFPFAPRSHSHSRTNSHSYPPTSLSLHQAHGPHLNLQPDVSRTISTRTNATTTSQPGSGHARAYTHHGITTPRFSAITAARSTISSLSTRWLGVGRRSELSLPPSLPHSRDSPRSNDGLVSPVSDISNGSALLPSPLRMNRSRSTMYENKDHVSMLGDGRDMSDWRHSNVRDRVTSMPRLPLPVVVSRGSWGRELDG